MTTVQARVYRPSATGIIPAGGSLQWTPTRATLLPGAPQTLVLPAPFTVNLTSDINTFELADSGPDWAWSVYEVFPGMASQTRLVAVPDSPDLVDYTTLVVVDPGTLTPVQQPNVPIWYAYVDGVEAEAAASAASSEASRVAAVAAQTAATGSQTSASNSASAAAGSAVAAASSAVNAASSATAAGNHVATALNHANNASTYAGQASASKDAAAASAATATTQGNAANAAATAADVSKTAAQTARTGAETARTGAEAAQAIATANANGFSAGQLTTGAPGTDVIVNISGSAPNRKLDLTIPRGLTGLTPNITIGNVTTGNPPQTTIGPTGPGGPQGAKGDPGDLMGTASGNVSGTITLTTAEYPSTRTWTLTGNVTLVLPTPASDKSGTISLVLIQDATGNRTVTWPAAVKWPEAIAQQPAPAALSVSFINLVWTGTLWLGMIGGKSFA